MESKFRSLRSRLHARLLQANSWLVIALLALGGWTLDALRLFLAMHDTLQAGLGAFASHFWYAVPMGIAIIVLTRLQPRPRLLGVAAYDEIGRLVHHEGDFSLDSLTVKGVLAALRHHGPHGLHGITLPSGASVYFVRDGGATLVLSFTAPPSSQELAAGIQRLRADTPMALDLLRGLEPKVAALAANLLSSPVKRTLLAFFRQWGHSGVELGDVAHWVGAGDEEVEQPLGDLIDLGLVQRQTVGDFTFYRLTRDEEATELLDEVFAWQEKWHAQRERLERMIG